MKHLFQHIKLTQRGVLHHLVPIAAFVLLFGIGGTYFYVSSRAAVPWSGALSLGSTTSGYCMDAPNLTQGATVELNKCNNKIDQKWERMSAGTVSGGGKTYNAFTIETFSASSGLCVDDWGQNKTPGRTNLLKLYRCNGVDPAQRFFWAGDNHQLRNVSSFLCIDDTGESKTANTGLDLYTCKASGQANQDWWEIANSASAAAPVPSTSPSPAPTASQHWSGALQLGLDRSLCLEENTPKIIATDNCGSSKKQQWSRVPITTTTFMLKAATSGGCLDDTGDGVGTNANNRVYLQTITCNSNDNAQVWEWGAGSKNHELVNVHNGACLNDPGNSKAPGQQQIVYSCAANSTNEQWFEAALAGNGSATTGTTSTTTSNNTSTTASSEVSAENADLQTLINSLSASQKQQINCSQLESVQAQELLGCATTKTTTQPQPFSNNHT